jgi:hypothetical protein
MRTCFELWFHSTTQATQNRWSKTFTFAREYSDILLDIIRITKPQNVVVVGRKAEKALAMVNIKSKYVRHQSRGGARAFENGIHSIFDYDRAASYTNSMRAKS